MIIMKIIIIITIIIITIIIIIIIRGFFQGQCLSLQTQEPRLQICPKAGLPPQIQELRPQFYSLQHLNRPKKI